jgi:tRNA(Phe) wybutosine-synthesizing methylase Tyw3
MYEFTDYRSGKCSDCGCDNLSVVGDTTVSEEYSTFVFNVEMTVVKMQSSHLGRVQRKIETILREVERSGAWFEFCYI